MPDFKGDLQLVVDGAAGGRLRGTVTGEGATLRLTTDQPGRMTEELRAAGPRDNASLDRAAQFLADEGIGLTLTGPHGDVLTAGAGVDSLLGRVVAGSRRVRPGSPRAVAPLVAGAVRDGLRRPSGRLVLALLGVAALVGRARRGR